MSAPPRTPLRPRIVSHRGRSSTNAILENRGPLFEQSPTGSPPPLMQKAAPTSASVGPSQSSMSFGSSTCLSSTGSSISARKKPMCRNCGTPMKGHKRGVCPIPAPKESWSLYTSAPEDERSEHTTPTRIPAKPERDMTETVTPTHSDTPSSSISASRNRKQYHCRKCGLPMKGHKRPSGILQCPVDIREPLDWEHETNLTPTPSSTLKTANVVRSKPSTPSEIDVKMSFVKKPTTPSAKHDTSPNGATLERSRDGTLAGKGRHRRSMTPAPNFALSEQRSSITPIRPIPSSSFQLNCTNDWYSSSRQKSTDLPPSNESSCSSVSAYMPIPISELASQSSETISTFDDLRQNFGEPELTIYSACSRDEAARIRKKAKELHYFSGVVNIRMQGRDDNEAKQSKDFYVKWVILSKKEEPVRRCVDLYKEHSLVV